MSLSNTSIQAREKAEIERSAFEADHSDVSHLRADEAEIIARYMNPPADTVYPLEYAYHVLGDVRGKTVLDFGCGSGDNTFLLARRGARVTALDISESLIRIARRRVAVNCGPEVDVRFVVSSAHDVAVAAESVDVVFGIAILHHLDLALVAREVRRVLRPGGRAIFQEPVRNSKVLAWCRDLVPYRAPDVSPFERPLTDTALDRFGHGFRPGRRRAFTLPFVNIAQIVPFLRSYIHPLCRLDGAILSRFSGARFYATTRVIELVK